MGPYREGKFSWHHSAGARLPASMAIVALLVASLGTAGRPTVLAAVAPRGNGPHLPTNNRIWQEGQWFQLSHVGTTHPPEEARVNALNQAASIATLGGTWTPLGPQPVNSIPLYNWGLVSGRITALAVNPTSTRDVWAGAADGGAWHSTNGGTTWMPMTDKQPSLTVGAIALDINAVTNTVYVGTGEANLSVDSYAGVGILRYTLVNGTKTWTRLGAAQFAGLSIAKIAVLDPDPANGNRPTLLVATDYPGGLTEGGSTKVPANLGVWRGTVTSTGGYSWSLVLHDATGCAYDTATDVVLDPAHPGTVYAGLANRFGYGTSQCTSMAGVYKSTNAGQTWTLLSSGIPTGNTIERVGLGISHDGTQLLAALTDAGTTSGTFGQMLNGSIYTSSTSGASWVGHAVPFQMAYSNTQLWYDLYATIDPTNSSVAYVGGIDIWKTTDGGANWTNLTTSYPSGFVHSDQHALAFVSASSSAFYLGNDGGVWKGDGTTSFTNLNSGGLNITQFYGGSSGTVGSHAQLYGGSQDNGEVQYPLGSTGATTWNEVYGGDGGATAVDYTNNAVVYEEYVNLQIHKSTDGGGSWSAATTGINPSGADKVNFIAPFILSPNVHTELLAGTDRVYRTTDGANSWSALSGAALDSTGCNGGPCPVSTLAMGTNSTGFPTADTDIYAGDNAGHVYVTTGGTGWRGGPVPGSTGGMVTGLAVDPTNPNTVYASFANFASAAGRHVFVSTTAGGSWTDISGSLPNTPCDSVLVDAHPGGTSYVVVGTDAGVYSAAIPSSGGRWVWAHLGSGLPTVALDQLFTAPGGTTLYAATHSRGMWQVPLP